MSMRRSTRRYRDELNMLQRAHMLFGLGFFQAPVWYQAMCRVPPPQLYAQEHPGRIELPTDKFRKALHSRLAILDLEIHNGVDFEAQKPLSVRMGRHFAKYIEVEGLSEDDAFEKCEVEFADDIAKLENDLMYVRGDTQPVTPANIAYVMTRRMEEQKLKRQACRKQVRRAKFSEITEANVNRILGFLPNLGTIQPLKQEDVEWAEDVEKRLRDFSLDYRDKLKDREDAVVQQLEDEIKNNKDLSAEDQEFALEQLHSMLRSIKKQEADEIRVHNIYANSAANRAMLRKERQEWIQSFLLDVMRVQYIPDYELQERDYIAFILKQQVLRLQLPHFVHWEPYTNCVDKTLWQQAYYLLRSTKLALLSREGGHDHFNTHNMAYPFELDYNQERELQFTYQFYDETQSELHDQYEQQRLVEQQRKSVCLEQYYGIFNSMPVIYSSQDTQRMSVEDKRKHVKLMQFIDAAMDRYEVKKEKDRLAEIERLKQEEAEKLKDTVEKIWARAEALNDRFRPAHEATNKTEADIDIYLLKRPSHKKKYSMDDEDLQHLDEDDRAYIIQRKLQKDAIKDAKELQAALQHRQQLLERACP